jgi:hypothetical protein
MEKIEAKIKAPLYLSPKGRGNGEDRSEDGCFLFVILDYHINHPVFYVDDFFWVAYLPAIRHHSISPPRGEEMEKNNAKIGILSLNLYHYVNHLVFYVDDFLGLLAL